jgi:hypothetical protein
VPLEPPEVSSCFNACVAGKGEKFVRDRIACIKPRALQIELCGESDQRQQQPARQEAGKQSRAGEERTLIILSLNRGLEVQPKIQKPRQQLG